MDKVSVSLTVFFEETSGFWVGVFERMAEGRLSACKVTFGTEPKDYEVDAFILKNYYKLRFSPAVAADSGDKAGGNWQVRQNPKRVQREVRKAVQNTGIGTKSQQALKLQQEQMKTERKSAGRAEREAKKERQFHLKQQKKKERHRGR